MLPLLNLRRRKYVAFVSILLAVISFIAVAAGGVVLVQAFSNQIWASDSTGFTVWLLILIFPVFFTFTFAMVLSVQGVTLLILRIRSIRNRRAMHPPSFSLPQNTPTSLSLPSTSMQGNTQYRSAPVLILLSVVLYNGSSAGGLLGLEPGLLGQLASSVTHPDTFFALPLHLLAGEIFLVTPIMVAGVFALLLRIQRIPIDHPMVTVDATGIVIMDSPRTVHLGWATMHLLSVKHYTVSRETLEKQEYDVFRVQSNRYDLTLRIQSNQEAGKGQNLAQSMRLMCAAYSPIPLLEERPTTVHPTPITTSYSASLVPTPAELANADTAQLPLALRPQLPWLYLINIMLSTPLLVSDIATVWWLRVTSYDVTGTYLPALNPPVLDPFLIPPDLRPPFWWLAFGLEIAIIFGSVVVLPLILYHAQPKITVSAEGVTVSRIGKRQFAHWHEIQAWQLETTRQSTIAGSITTLNGRTITWKEFPKRGVSEAVMGRKASQAKDAFLQRSRQIHAIIMQRTQLPPTTPTKTPYLSTSVRVNG